MPSTSFLLAIGVGAIILALLTAAFGAWCSTRYDETEKRYLIQYAAVLPCFGLLVYLDLRHHAFCGVGVFTVVYYTAIRRFSAPKRKTTNHVAK